jgi:hypothetical protein
MTIFFHALKPENQTEKYGMEGEKKWIEIL